MKTMRWAMAAVGVAALSGGCMTTGTDSAGTATGFINATMTVDGKTLPYNVYVPRDYTPDTAWPLVVFLHGRGERGNDGLLQTEVGMGSAIRRNPDRFPCIVAMPQCPGDSHWPDRHDVIETALNDAIATYNIDPSRVYLTGLSMGGYGTWSYGAAHPDRFAALVPICGGGDPATAAALATVPIRVYHGADDSVVPAAKSREMVAAVEAAGGDIAYTEYPGVDHNSWDQTYRDAAVIAWMLAQRR